ncbi:MAG TPA: NAD(P)H-hydrate dehydratase [Terriglobia bacterium]|nr:NAD(P)H-hydrate dehydratase [Terriglobia bacterium]
MKILTAAQMQRIDLITTERCGIPSLELMENAGRAAVEFLARRFAPLAAQKVTVVCGRGNNGGDGLVVARLLGEQGTEPRVVLLADPASLKEDAAYNFKLLAARSAPEIASDVQAWRALKDSLAGTTLWVDAILGTGLSRPVEGYLAEVIRDLNNNFPPSKIVAIDLPSGLGADSGELIGDSVRAGATVIFTAPKWAHVFPPACERIGEWVVQQIGTPPDLLNEDPELFLNLTVPSDLAWLMRPRNVEAHKGDFGRVLILAGSVGKTGAAALAAKAALRAGAGLVTVATAASAQPIVASLGMEYMTEALPETESGTVSLRALDYGRLEKLMEGKTVLAIGPGLGTVPETAEFARTVVNESKIPVVVDADGLNAFAGCMNTFRSGRPSPPETVLTPHPGEMSRLAGMSTAEIQARRVEFAREFSVQHKVNLVLKGFRTLIASPSGAVAVNPTGNPGMAKGGSGDVLTGIIAGLLAQYPTIPFAQVVAGAVYLHGLAGDLAAAQSDPASMIASDLLEALPKAYSVLRKSEDR